MQRPVWLLLVRLSVLLRPPPAKAAVGTIIIAAAIAPAISVFFISVFLTGVIGN